MEPAFWWDLRFIGVSSMSSSSLSSVQDVSERAAWGVLVCEPQHREADPGGPNHPGGPRVSSLLQRAAGGSRATHPADAVNLQPAAGAWHRPPPLSKAGRARRALAWWVEGGFSRSSDTCIYIWKETSTELSTPPPAPPTPPLPAFPLPSWRCLHPPSSSPCWAGSGWLQCGAGVKVWEREKRNFYF